MRGRDASTSQDRAVANHSPGPCHYETSSNFGKDAQSVTIRGKPEWKPLNRNPGPCDYDWKTEVSKPRTPSTNISKTERRSFKRDPTPPVGQYDTHRIGEFGKSVQGGIIGNRPEWKPLNENPPPGYYQPNKDAILASTKQTIDISKKAKHSRFHLPEKATRHISSASYDYIKPFGSDVKFKTIQGRPKFKPLNNNPTPTQYDPNINSIKPVKQNMMTSKS